MFVLNLLLLMQWYHTQNMLKSPNQWQADIINEIKLLNIGYLARTARKYDYHITQRNGQRIFGPPKGEPLLNLSYEHELFVTNIPLNCYEHMFLEYFLQVGGLYTFRYMLDYTGGGRGFAFAKYKTVTSANYARLRINQIYIMGHSIRVYSCRNKGTLIIGNLSKNKIVDCGGREDSILNYCLATFGSIVQVKIRYQCNLKLSYFIEFCEHRDAALARRHLKNNRLQLFGKKVFISWDL